MKGLVICLKLDELTAEFFKSKKIIFDDLLKQLENDTLSKIFIPICSEHYKSAKSLLNDIDHDNDDLMIDDIDKKYVLSKSEWVRNGFVAEIELNKKNSKCTSCDNINCDYVVVLHKLFLGDSKHTPKFNNTTNSQ